MPTTAASKILKNFKPPYESFVTQKLLDQGAILTWPRLPRHRLPHARWPLGQDPLATGGSLLQSIRGLG